MSSFLIGDEGYEVLPNFIGEPGYNQTLAASFTPNNGIRISVLDCDDADEGALYAEFNLSIDQARTLGEALIRWAEARAKMEAR